MADWTATLGVGGHCMSRVPKSPGWPVRINSLAWIVILDMGISPQTELRSCHRLLVHLNCSNPAETDTRL